jgi:predicted transcriptional regulator
MSNYNRNRIDIITSILNTAKGNEVKQLDILNKSKLTHGLFKECLCIILQFGLIEYMLQGTYKTTEKGIHFIDIYDKMKNLIQ